MPAPLSKTKRYTAPGITKTYFLPAVAILTAPSRAEMEAGSDHTKEIADMTGWEVKADRIAAPDLGSKLTGKTNGRVNVGDAQISYYASEDTQDVRQVLQRDDVGFIMILDGGDVEGQLARVFAVQVAAVTPSISVAGSENSRIMVDFSINDVAEQVTIPALA